MHPTVEMTVPVLLCNARMTTNQRGRVCLLACLFVNSVTPITFCYSGCSGCSKEDNDEVYCVVTWMHEDVLSGINATTILKGALVYKINHEICVTAIAIGW